MLCRELEELGPFGRAPGIGDVAADEDEVERLCRMDFVELRQHAPEPLIAARSAAAAFDAKAEALADHMDV